MRGPTRSCPESGSTITDISSNARIFAEAGTANVSDSEGADAGAVAALAIAWMTVLTHALRVASANPIYALRYE